VFGCFSIFVVTCSRLSLCLFLAHIAFFTKKLNDYLSLSLFGRFLLNETLPQSCGRYLPNFQYMRENEEGTKGTK
jgi:hypothetical protein